MNKKILGALVLVFAAFSLNAQEGARKMHRGQHKAHAIHEKMNLSDEQKAKMKTLNEEFRKKVSDLKKNEDITVKEWKSRMETLRKQHQDNMKALLTTEQKNTIEKMKAERKAKTAIDNKARMEKMKIDLGLNESQVARLEKQRSEYSAKIKALHENKALSQEQKREQMQSLMKQRKEEMKSILTEEQMKKMEEKRKHPGMRRKARLS